MFYISKNMGTNRLPFWKFLALSDFFHIIKLKVPPTFFRYCVTQRSEINSHFCFLRFSSWRKRVSRVLSVTSFLRFVPVNPVRLISRNFHSVEGTLSLAFIANFDLRKMLCKLNFFSAPGIIPQKMTEK